MIAANNLGIESQCPSTTELQKAFADFKATLAEAFGVSFDLWMPGETWTLVLEKDDTSSETADSSAQFDRRLLMRDNAEAGPYAIESPKGQWLLAVPFSHEGEFVAVATASFETSQPELLVNTAKMCLKQMDLVGQVNDLLFENSGFVRQVTDDLEELTFLRQIAEHLEISDGASDISLMAGNMLHLLKYSIKAQTVALLPFDDDKENAGVLKSIVRIDSEFLDDADCRLLVDLHREQAKLGPILRNKFKPQPGQEKLAGIRGFILTPLTKSNQVLGWLLAVNRVPPKRNLASDSAWNLMNKEFGSSEATLLCSAAAMLASTVSNMQLFAEKQKLFTNVVRSLVSAIEAKDSYTCGHSERVALYGRLLAQEIGYDEESLERLYLSGLLHDVGKIGIADSTLRKPGKLTVEEYNEIKRHPDEGWAILHDLDELQSTLPGVLFHHERVDGKGYPDGLSGSNIPLDGRVLAVADAFDAMTSDRPYRHGMPMEKAFSILREGAGTQWDERLVDAFFRRKYDVQQIKETYRQKQSPRRIAGGIKDINDQKRK